MGGTKQVSDHEEKAWCGGEPNRNWTGLAATAATEPKGATQFRENNTSYASKAKGYRTKGQSVLFERSSDLELFQSRVMEHLQRHGMDSITYVPDPADLTKMISSVTHHPRLSAEFVLSHIEDQVSKYDKYDKENDDDAKTHLMSSIDDDLNKELRGMLDFQATSFPVLFIRFISIIRQQSLTHFRLLEQRIRNRSADNYPGQDLAQLASDTRKDAHELDIAGQYDHKITVDILKIALAAGGPSPSIEIQDFHFQLRSMKLKLETKLLESSYMSKVEQTRIMSQEHLTYLHACNTISDTYRKLLSSDQWTPALSNKDSKAAPQLPSGQLHGNAIFPAQQQDGSPSFSKDSGYNSQDKRCNNCGEPGHFAKGCLRPKRNFKSQSNGNQKSSSGNRYRQQRNNGKKGVSLKNLWKTKPPGQGESTTKQVKGRTWFWCKHCNSWSTTHGTSGHTGPIPSKKHFANYLELEPAAWHADFDSSPSIRDSIRLGISLLCPFLIGFVSLFLSFFLCRSMFDGTLNFESAPVPLRAILSVIGTYWQSALMIVHWSILLFGSFVTRIHGQRENIAKLVEDVKATPPRWIRRQGPQFRKRRSRFFRRNESSTPPRTTQQFREPRSQMNRTRALSRMRRDGERQAFAYHRNVLAQTDATSRMLSATLRQNLLNRSSRKPEGEGNVCAFNNHNPRSCKAERPAVKRPSGRQETCGPRPHYRPARTKSRAYMTRENRFYNPVGPFNFGLTNSQVKALRSPLSTVQFARPLPSDNLLPAMARHFFKPIQAGIAAFYAPLPTKRPQVIWDSGASISITHSRQDFVGPIENTPVGVKLQGLAKGVNVKAKGHVAWSFIDATGMLRTLKLPALYVPDSKVRLLSTSSLLKTYPGESIKLGKDRLVLSGQGSKGGVHRRNAIEVLIQQDSNLPMSTLFQEPTADKPERQERAFPAAQTVVSPFNTNLSEAEKELLRWHYKLGHLSQKKVQFLLRTGVLANTERTRRLHAAASRLHHLPLCTSCQYGKQRRRPAPGLRRTVVTDREGALKHNDLFPGENVSVDHFVCSTKGRLLHGYGKEDPKTQFVGGALFVDHASGYIFINEQVHLNTHCTIASKEAFEAHCRDFGVVPQAYISDNGSTFTSKDYVDHLKRFNQVTKYAGVGAHHHNGVAERSIQTIMSIARTMMIHSALHWPDVQDSKLWPLAVRHAAYLFNRMPNPSTGVSPLDIFSRTRQPQAKFHDLHVWGCPVYVLEKRIADGNKIPKWSSRSNRQLYLGVSDKHAGTVPLVLNLETGKITPQFHVVVDDWFATVETDSDRLPDMDTEEWRRLFGDSAYQYVSDVDEDRVDTPGTLASPNSVQIQNPPPILLPSPRQLDYSDAGHAHKFASRQADISNAYLQTTPKQPAFELQDPTVSSQKKAPPASTSVSPSIAPQQREQAPSGVSPPGSEKPLRRAPASPPVQLESPISPAKVSIQREKSKAVKPAVAVRRSNRSHKPKLMLSPDPKAKSYTDSIAHFSNYAFSAEPVSNSSKLPLLPLKLARLATLTSLLGSKPCSLARGSSGSQLQRQRFRR